MIKNNFVIDKQFQTPIWVCNLMADMLEQTKLEILEPTPGLGNLVNTLVSKGHNVIVPNNVFEDIDLNSRFDAIVMNPPFTPMKKGYEILDKCMNMTDEIVALMPWLTLINSVKRTQKIVDFGLKAISHLPRTVFSGSRVQCCVIHMISGYKGETKIMFPLQP